MLKWNLENYYSLQDEESRSCFILTEQWYEVEVATDMAGGREHNYFPNFIKPGRGGSMKF